MPDITGVCEGGPFDGQMVTGPDDEPFLATRRDIGKLYIYRWDGEGVFRVVTDHDSSLVLPGGDETGERAMSWPRLDTSRLREIPVADVEENHAGAPVPDGWDVPSELPPG